MIRHKIIPETPDNICKVCVQFYDGNCRAFSVPHSKAEEEARMSDYGMECDEPDLKEIRKKMGIKYKT